MTKKKIQIVVSLSHQTWPRPLSSSSSNKMFFLEFFKMKMARTFTHFEAVPVCIYVSGRYIHFGGQCACVIGGLRLCVCVCVCVLFDDT